MAVWGYGESCGRSGSGPSVPLGNVSHNTIIHNGGYGIQLGGPTPYAVSISRNNIFGNGNYDIYLVAGSAGTQNFTVDAADNFWGIDASQIPNRIHDCSFDDNGCGSPFSTVGKVTYLPQLVDPEQAAPAFVRSVTLDPNPVGMQMGAITVDFSRPMVTDTVPTVSFHDSRRATTEAFTVTTGSVFEMKLTKDGLGRMWFGESNKLLMYNKGRWLRYTLPADTQPAVVSALYGTAVGDLWVGLNGSSTALAVLRGTTWTTFTQEVLAGPSAAGVTSIAEDNYGAMWIGTPVGASRSTAVSGRATTSRTASAAIMYGRS